ncbi:MULTISPECIES: ABC transporter ATP-binding protein [Lascolabacillus]|jgi:subfamily B ATP-binding cassette protein MsbA|uniref:ABC transporter ATP-binding protein n=1 Tax=Lascolabacillus TaxID=1924067 RepID=UPI0006B33DF7|nr:MULTISPECIES: ABC transporter ATP-binding protein [Lascolabacillus]MBP6176379.1 ABC transporter ATP-binding protein [Fermentimonas sp.]MDI9625063.1 ABC transporter ATP-binding protein [Bacteroidota bacterium]TAH60217.1 MAG: ABC transporter ATP-binding protein [Fermentimonas caenicola]MBP7105270.1 ABC transporter ATP-binding protein [Fermentimonas sp.]MDD2607615.1 ABC transporter ATP-binding protein [Lascolabacillus sp.]
MKGIILILKRFLPPYKKHLFLAFFFNILTAILNVFSLATIIPILQVLFKVNKQTFEFIPWKGTEYSIIDITLNNVNWYITQLIETNGSSYTLMLLAVTLIIMTLLKTASAYLGSYFIIPIRTGVVKDIRNNINDKILSLPLAFFSEERKGDILSRISGDVNEVENSVMSSLDMLFKNPILILIYLTTMTVLSWQLTLFVLLVLPIMGFIMGRVGRTLKRTSFEAQNKWGELMSQVEETLSGLRVIKAFVAENKISKRFHNGSNEFRRMSNRISRRQQLAHPMSELLGTITIAIVLWFGGSLILGNNSAIDAATFIYYLTIFYSIINPAKEFSKSAYAVQRGLASMERIDKILDAKNPITDPEKPVDINFNSKIEYKGVWFKYINDWVIKGVNLTIEKGKTIALVGQSGSGKSTLADLLPRFYDIQEGGIYIDGVDIRDVKIHELRSLMGNVNQDPILFNDTIYNNIAFGMKDVSESRVIEAAKIANAHEFIMATEDGYNTNIGDRGGKLSGGQRQRISIARAILKNPEILIFDEATSALDTDSERLVQEALDKLMKDRTTIIIAHRLSTIRNADTIYVMKDGEIVEQGKHDSLYKLGGYYTKLCDMQGEL